jgi:hypothetical protein
MQDDDYLGFPPDRTPLPPEAITKIVNDAKNLIETATLANPDEYKDFEWRLRPSVKRQIAIEQYLNPQPPWGLRVNLASLYIGPTHCNAIAQSMLLCKTVTSLDLSMCDMQTDSAVYLFKCLKGRNKVLRHLNISGNFIDAAGGVAAASCVPQLESLHIACNNIGDEGCVAIAQQLRCSNTMKFLNVRANNITNTGVYYLLQALEPMEAMTIDINDMKSPSRGVSTAPATDIEVVAPTTSTMQSMLAASTNRATQPAASPSGPQRRQSRLYSTAIMTIATGRNGEEASPPADRQPAVPFLDPAIKNTSVNALWFQLNSNISRILVDRINTILAARFPQPPEGFNDKKKKGKKGKK